LLARDYVAASTIAAAASADAAATAGAATSFSSSSYSSASGVDIGASEASSPDSSILGSKLAILSNFSLCFISIAFSAAFSALSLVLSDTSSTSLTLSSPSS